MKRDDKPEKKPGKRNYLFINEIDRINKKGILMSVGAFALIIVFFILYNLTYSRSARRYFSKQAVDTITNVSAQFSNEISSQVNSWYAELECSEQAVLLYDEEDDIYELDEALTALGKTPHSEFDDIGVLQDNGTIYFSSKKSYNAAGEEYIQDILESGHSEFAGTLAIEGLEDYIMFAIPFVRDIKLINGSHIKAMVGMIEKSKVSEMIKTEVFGHGNTYIVIAEADGDMLVDTDAKKRMHGNVFDVYTGFAEESVVEKLKKDFAEGKSDVIDIMGETTKFITYYVPVKTSIENDKYSISNWRILVMTSEMLVTQNISELFNESRNFLGIVLIILAFVLVSECMIYRRNKIAECRLSSIDRVTGVHNNSRFVKDANILLGRNNKDYLVISFDIIKFGLINNEIGHEKGDIVLKTIGQTIQNCIGADELVAHSFADMYVMLVKLRGGTPETTIEYFRKKLADAWYPNGIKVRFNAGVYVVRPEDKDISFILDCARFARQKVKETKNRQGMLIYTEELFEKQKREYTLERMAVQAIQEEKFAVYYQMKRDIQNNCWCGAEALVRWIDPELGFVSPGEFIPLFERNGFVVNIDKYVFNRVCADIEQLVKNGEKTYPVSVNVSKKHLENENFMQDYEDILLSYDIPHELIEFEITENMVVTNEELLKHFIAWVHRLGCKCSLDDFGSGYSSFNMVREFEFDTIKIDRKFFYGSNGFDQSSRLIVESLIDLSHKLGKSVISEGIENEEQVEFLKIHRCDAVQGFYFSKPAPLDKSIRGAK